MNDIHQLAIEGLTLEEECEAILNDETLEESERKTLIQIKLALIRAKFAAIKDLAQ